MASIPTTMRSLVAPKPCKPAQYDVIELPVPTIKAPNDVLVKIHAATLTPSETQIAAGQFNLLTKVPFPNKLGIEGSGVVVAIGSAVTAFRPGDAVYGCHFVRPALPPQAPGFCSEYVVANASMLLLKPASLSFEDTAGLLGGTLTAYQSLRLGLALTGDVDGSLEGKTVFVPGALSGTGSAGCQIAKSVFGAKRVVSTVSTVKVPLVEEQMPGVVDQVVDYQTQDMVREVGRGKVDLVYNTQWHLTSTFPLLNPQTGVVVSIASIPNSELMREVVGVDNVPFWMGWILDLAQLWYGWKLWGTNVKMGFVSGNPGAREDFEKVGEIIATGKVKPVMTVVELGDIEAIRKESQKIFTGKGGLGKLVIKIA